MIRPENSEDEAMNGKLLVTGMLVSLVGIAIYESLLVRGLSPMPGDGTNRNPALTAGSRQIEPAPVGLLEQSGTCVTQLNAQIEAEHSSAAESAIASPSRNDDNTMARSDHTLFLDKLRDYCLESKHHEAASRRQDLAHKVRYICNDLELILAELQSPAFTEFNPTQKHWLQQSQTAVQNAMHHLDLTNQACHYVPTKGRKKHRFNSAFADIDHLDDGSRARCCGDTRNGPCDATILQRRSTDPQLPAASQGCSGHPLFLGVVQDHP